MSTQTTVAGRATSGDRKRRVATAPGRSPQGSGAGGTALTALTWVLALAFFFPVFWMVLTGFKNEADAYTETPRVIFAPTLEQFTTVLDRAAPFFLNSFVATVVSTVLVLALAVPAAYALSIRPVKKTQDVLFFAISTKMLPVVAVIVPLYVIAGQIRRSTTSGS